MTDEITISKKNLWMYSTFVLIAVVVIGGILMFSGNSTGTNNTGGTGTGLVTASVDDDPVLGDSNAEITIIEFSDYQCFFCRKFWTETLPQIKTEYIDTGKVNLVFRDLPLGSIHPMAQASAEAAEAVRELGGDEAYYAFHDKMFSEQNLLDSKRSAGSYSTVTYTVADLKAWASEIGYDISSALDSGKYASEVQKDARDAQAAGGTGTPYFVIVGSDGKGTALSGAQPFSVFKQAIDAKLG